MAKRPGGIPYFTHRGRRRHPSSVIGSISHGLILPLSLVLIVTVATTGAVILPWSAHVEAGTLVLALFQSLARLTIAFLLALVTGVALGLIAERGRHTEAVLLPIFDVLESMPVLAFFPAIIILFIRGGFIEGAAIFIIYFSMVWNIAFSTVSGLKQTPAEVRAVGTVFGLSPWRRFKDILLPALFPALLTGSILSVADGWNILIVAEALHAYAPVTSGAHDLPGIGSMLVTASLTQDTGTLVAAMTVLVIAVAVMNIALWQPLLAYAKRFSFE